MIKNLFNCSLRPGGLSNVGRAYLEISSTEIVVQKIVKIVKFIILMPYLLINDLFCIGKRGESGILTRGQLFTSNHQIKILKIGLSCLGALYSCPYIRKKLYANGSQQIPFYKNNAFLISGGALVLSVIAASLIYYKKKLQ